MSCWVYRSVCSTVTFLSINRKQKHRVRLKMPSVRKVDLPWNLPSVHLNLKLFLSNCVTEHISCWILPHGFDAAVAVVGWGGGHLGKRPEKVGGNQKDSTWWTVLLNRDWVTLLFVSRYRRHVTEGALVNVEIKCVMKQIKISRLEAQTVQQLFKTKVVVWGNKDIRQ